MPFKRLRTNLNADIGIGALIIFIAMILVAGITASVMIQTMSSLQERAVQTSQDTLKDISSGVKVSHISGYVQNASITQLAIFVSTIAASDSIDLTYGMLTLSDSTTKVILNYSSTCFSQSVSALFLIHLSSPHSYRLMSHTIDADFGGVSEANAYGSDFICW